MATSTATHKISKDKPSIKNGLGLIWLDDSAGQDPNAKDIFRPLFEQVFIFTDPEQCLEVVESADGASPCISILVSGKYGQMFAHDRFQQLPQVKNIYVYCFDINKHNKWAQKCDKVRCVESDLGKIFKHIQHDVQKSMKEKNPEIDDQQEQEQEQENEELLPIDLERFTFDNNFYDQLAFDLILDKSDDDKNDGTEDFKKYCETHMPNNDRENEEYQEYFKSNVSIKEWYKQDLCFLNINATSLSQLWTLRWFIRLFHRQLTNEHKCFMKDKASITVNYGTWLTTNELNAMKLRIGESVIFTEVFVSYTTKLNALKAIKDEINKEKTNKIIFEILAEKSKQTVPYTEVQTDAILFWFGSRHRILKVEYIESQKTDEDSYWLIGLKLCSTLETNKSIESLYQYYGKQLTDLKDLYHALGRILIYKGLYYEAEKWLQTNNHYQELAELAIRMNQYEKANQYLQKLPEDSDDVNLLRAYLHLLLSNDNVAKGRSLLMKINSDTTDKMIRARINTGLGFVNLLAANQSDQALDYFSIGSEALCKLLPDIHPDIAKSYIGIGYALFAQKNIKEAEKYFEKAWIIQKQSLSMLHPDIAKTRNGIAHCLSVQKQTFKQAEEEFQDAYNILMHTFPRENKKHPEILSTMVDIDRLRKGKELHVRTTILDYI